MAVVLRERAEHLVTRAPTQITLRQLEAEQARLERRLEAGVSLIETARGRGESVERLEHHWRDLLHVYEQLSLLIARCRAGR